MPGRAGVIVPFLFIGVKMIKSIKQIFLETNWEEAEGILMAISHQPGLHNFSRVSKTNKIYRVKL